MKIAESSLIIDYRRNSANKLDFFFSLKKPQHNKQCLFSFQKSDGFFFSTSDKENPIHAWLVSKNRYVRLHALYTNPYKNYIHTLTVYSQLPDGEQFLHPAFVLLRIDIFCFLVYRKLLFVI